MMEEVGVVGPGSGAKPREILVDSWPPERNMTEGTPTAQDDYDEAYARDMKEEESEEEVEEEEKEINDEPVDWEESVDDGWLEEDRDKT
jgi:hypothetical protein